MKTVEQSGFYVEQLTGSQNRLYAYIYSLSGDHEQAADVLVRTTVLTMTGFDTTNNVYFFPFYSAMELKDVTDGMMLVDIAPEGAEEPSFHGLIKASGSGPNPEKKVKRVEKMIRTLFKDFPTLPAEGGS